MPCAKSSVLVQLTHVNDEMSFALFCHSEFEVSVLIYTC